MDRVSNQALDRVQIAQLRDTRLHRAFVTSMAKDGAFRSVLLTRPTISTLPNNG